MRDPNSESRIRFCIPGNRTPYIEIDGVKYRVGERTDCDSKLNSVLGHQGKEFTERDFALIMFLALEAKRMDEREIELPCECIAGKRGWHEDARQVRTGVSRRFDGPVRTYKNRVIWAPSSVHCEFDDEQRCRRYLEVRREESSNKPDDRDDSEQQLADLGRKLDILADHVTRLLAHLDDR